MKNTTNSSSSSSLNNQAKNFLQEFDQSVDSEDNYAIALMKALANKVVKDFDFVKEVFDIASSLSVWDREVYYREEISLSLIGSLGIEYFIKERIFQGDGKFSSEEAKQLEELYERDNKLKISFSSYIFHQVIADILREHGSDTAEETAKVFGVNIDPENKKLLKAVVDYGEDCLLLADCSGVERITQLRQKFPALKMDCFNEAIRYAIVYAIANGEFKYGKELRQASIPPISCRERPTECLEGASYLFPFKHNQIVLGYIKGRRSRKCQKNGFSIPQQENWDFLNLAIKRFGWGNKEKVILLSRALANGEERKLFDLDKAQEVLGLDDQELYYGIINAITNNSLEDILELFQNYYGKPLTAEEIIAGLRFNIEEKRIIPYNLTIPYFRELWRKLGIETEIQEFLKEYPEKN